LSRFLETVRANRALFSDDAFKKRLKDNTHVDSLVKDRPVDDDTLDADLQTVLKSDPLVKSLHDLRNKAIAHTDADVVKTDTEAANKGWLPPDDIEKPLRKASDITAKYSLYYGASCYSGVAAADDFKNTLGWLRKALVAHDTEIEEQIRRAQKMGSEQ
jgi:uncharacterized protein (DUF427 family)